jgi:predicted alpha/beta hydrolase family esterase
VRDSDLMIASAPTIDRLLLVPRWSGHADSDCYPWLRQRLVERGFCGELATAPLQPPDAPDLAATVAAVREQLGPAARAARTLVLGHSVGAQAVMRAVAELPQDAQVGAVLLMAAWWDVDRPWPTIVPWIETPFAWDRTRTVAQRCVVLLSTNDPFTADSARTRRLFEERLGADVHTHEGAKHFNASEEPAVLAVASELLGLPTAP